MDVFPSRNDQGRSSIAVTGDIDLGTAEDLLVRLTALIGSPRHEISLDLSGVTFIDCAGLRTLTAIDARTRANGTSIRLTAMSPAVARLFELVYALWDTDMPAAAPTAASGPAFVATGRTTAPEQTDAPRCDRIPAWRGTRTRGDTSLAEALVRLRAHAHGNDRPIAEVAADAVARRLRLEDPNR
jgi:anti-anti-sigma factor